MTAANDNRAPVPVGGRAGIVMGGVDHGAIVTVRTLPASPRNCATVTPLSFRAALVPA